MRTMLTIAAGLILGGLLASLIAKWGAREVFQHAGNNTSPEIALRGDERSQPTQPQWRRTTDGWERREYWNWTAPQPASPIFHPGLLAAFQVMTSLFALLVWPPHLNTNQPQSNVCSTLFRAAYEGVST